MCWGVCLWWLAKKVDEWQGSSELSDIIKKARALLNSGDPETVRKAAEILAKAHGGGVMRSVRLGHRIRRINEMKIGKCLSIFERTNSENVFNVAGWHHPRSINWWWLVTLETKTAMQQFAKRLEEGVRDEYGYVTNKAPPPKTPSRDAVTQLSQMIKLLDNFTTFFYLTTDTLTEHEIYFFEASIEDDRPSTLVFNPTLFHKVIEVFEASDKTLVSYSEWRKP